MIDLTVQKGDDMLLYVLIHSDGTMNRMGSINEEFSAPGSGPTLGPAIGMTDRPLFEELVSHLTPELAHWVGQHDLGGDGERSNLTFTVALGRRGGRIEFSYGSNARPLPAVVREFAHAMIKLSDRWLAESGVVPGNGRPSEPEPAG